MEITKRYFIYWKRSALLLFALLLIVAFTDREKVFLILNQVGSPLGVTFWGLITNLGDGFVAGLIPLFFARKRPDIIRASLIATAVAVPFVQGIKFLTTVIRPGFIIPEAIVYGHQPSSWSFPSGHTATVAVILGVIWLMADSRFGRWTALILMFLGGFSRIAIGVHWPIDVIIGFLIGISSAAAGAILTKDNRNCTLKVAGLTLFLSIAAVMFLIDYNLNPSFPIIQKVFGITALIFGITATISIVKRSLPWKR